MRGEQTAAFAELRMAEFRKGGRPVAIALQGAVLALPARIAGKGPSAAEASLWEPHGIHGAVLEAYEYTKARIRMFAQFEAWARKQSKAA